jgi:hypothetical protein
MNSGNPLPSRESGDLALGLLALAPLVLGVLSLATAGPSSVAAWAVLGVLALALGIGLLYLAGPRHDAS